MNIRIEKKHLPSNIRAFCVRCYEDCDYFTIFVNCNLNEQVQLDALLHELDHIRKDDFTCIANANMLERMRHNEE